MRHPIALTLALVVTLAGCGAKPDSAAENLAVEQTIPDNDANSPAMGGMMAGLNTDIAIDPDIINAWSGIRIRVIEIETGSEQTFESPLGAADLLGDSGLVLTVETFIPDFVMDEDGITTRSGETDNPAARVIISEDGMADYEGWLFAKMPEIHPYPHTRYQVLLVEGIPSK
jgi:hypothetical protein